MTQEIYKILVVGASGVGKTKLLSNFADYIFKKTAQNNLNFQKVSYVLRDNDKIGILAFDFILKGLILENRNFRFHFWDFKGDDDNLSTHHFKGATGALIVFDHSKPETLNRALKHIEKIRNLKCPYGIIGTKVEVVKGKALKVIGVEKASFYINASSKSFEESNNAQEEFKNMIEDFLLKIVNGNYVKLLQKEVNLQILIALHLHKTLSLTELAHYLNKSKATISRKTSNLITLGLIEANEAEFEKTRGSIKKKYYAIRPDFQNLIGRNKTKFGDGRNPNNLIKIREERWRMIYITSLIFHQSGLFLDLLYDFPLVTNSIRKKELVNFMKIISNVSLKLDFLTQNLDDGRKKEHMHFEVILPILNKKYVPSVDV